MAVRKIRIGLMADFINSEYSENLINGITSCCTELGIDFLLFQVGAIQNAGINNYNFQYASITSQIKKQNLDGIIITSGTQLHGLTKEEFVSYLKSFKPLKIVSISMELPGIPSIVVDCDKAFESLISYLIEQQGCRRFGFMGVKSKADEFLRRTEIFYSTLKRYGIKRSDVIEWISDLDYSSAYAQLHLYNKASANPNFDVDAVVALNDDTAYACMDFFEKRLNKRIPEDVIITGFDDLQRASFSTPTLTSVNQKVTFQGYKAAQTLYKIIKKEKYNTNQVIQGQTILRQSTRRKILEQDNFSDTESIKLDKTTAIEFASKFSVSEWYTKRSQIYQAARLQTDSTPNITVEQLKYMLTEELRTFGFQAGAVILYETPIEKAEPFDSFTPPHKARLIAGFDYKKGFNASYMEDTIYFDPNECMIPEQYYGFSSEGTVVLSLFHNHIQYGYILIRQGNYDMGVYDLIARTIAYQIAIAMSYDKITRETSAIQDRYQKLDVIAHTDELTGLTNRRGYMEVGATTLNFGEAMGQSGLVLYCDMDGLKTINDTYGHDAGDMAIKAQAKILKMNFRSNDVIARLAGDEFSVISLGLTKEVFKTVKKKIENDCKKWSKENELPFELSISLGYAEFPSQEHGYRLDELLKESDEALYIEKRKKKEKLARKKNSIKE